MAAGALLEARRSYSRFEELLDTPGWGHAAIAVYSHKQAAFHFAAQHELIQELCIHNTFAIAMLKHALIATAEKRPSEYLPFCK